MIPTVRSAQVAVAIPKNLISANVRLLKKVTREDLHLGDVFIYATKFINDGRLLASDRTNKSLLMFNSNFGFIKRHPVAGGPWGLCASADGTTVHVVCDRTKVVTYTLQGEWKEISQFKTEPDTYGLDRSGDTLISGTKTHVVLYNKDGEKLSSIKHQAGGFERTICISAKSDMIFYHTNGDKLVGRTLQDRKEI